MTPDGFRALRYRHAMPQAELARVLGISRSKVVELEQGRSQPTRLLLLALSAYFAGLEPYDSDPEDLRAFAVQKPLRINRSEPGPGLHPADLAASTSVDGRAPTDRGRSL